MFIVKLILVPLWPFFIANWAMKKTNSEFNLKSYLATLLICYVVLIGILVEVGGKVINMFKDDKAQAPTAEVQEATETDTDSK